MTKGYPRLFKGVILYILLMAAGCVGYNVEKDGVYYKQFNEANGQNKRLIENADPFTFTALEFEYGKDRTSVYYQGRVIPGADPASFKTMSRLYATDAQRAYHAGDSIASSSPEDFAIIDEYYSRDKKNVFYTTHPLNVCSIRNFFIYSNRIESDKLERWSTDGCYYYFKHHRIPSKDYNNTRIYFGSAGFAKDRQWVYYRDRKINFNDQGERIIDTVDVQTFSVSEYIKCRDKYGCINVYHGRKNCD